MPMYRFLGRESALMLSGVPKYVLNRWGQPVEFPDDDEARNWITLGIPLMPDAEFKKRFTAEEANKYELRGMHDILPTDPAEAKVHADFIERRDKAVADLPELNKPAVKDEFVPLPLYHQGQVAE